MYLLKKSHFCLVFLAAVLLGCGNDRRAATFENQLGDVMPKQQESYIFEMSQSRFSVAQILEIVADGNLESADYQYYFRNTHDDLGRFAKQEGYIADASSNSPTDQYDNLVNLYEVRYSSNNQWQIQSSTHTSSESLSAPNLIDQETTRVNTWDKNRITRVDVNTVTPESDSVEVYEYKYNDLDFITGWYLIDEGDAELRDLVVEYERGDDNSVKAVKYSYGSDITDWQKDFTYGSYGRLEDYLYSYVGEESLFSGYSLSFEYHYLTEGESFYRVSVVHFEWSNRDGFDSKDILQVRVDKFLMGHCMPDELHHQRVSTQDQFRCLPESYWQASL